MCRHLFSHHPNPGACYEWITLQRNPAPNHGVTPAFKYSLVEALNITGQRQAMLDILCLSSGPIESTAQRKSREHYLIWIFYCKNKHTKRLFANRVTNQNRYEAQVSAVTAQFTSHGWESTVFYCNWLPDNYIPFRVWHCISLFVADWLGSYKATLTWSLSFVQGQSQHFREIGTV